MDTKGNPQGFFPSRRLFVVSVGAQLASLTCFPSLTFARQSFDDFRQLDLHNIHTGERLRIPYWEMGTFITESLEAINFILRDFRTGDVHTIDPRLLDVVYRVRKKLGTKKPVQIISGYRSPKTNEKLRGASQGVAKRSFHVLGQAIDLRIEDVSTRDLQKAALSLRTGGVGYYPKSQFVHMDTGPVRRW